MRFNADPTVAVLPAVVEALDGHDDFAVRAKALGLVRTKLAGPQHWYRLDLDEVMVDPQIREIITLIADMAGSAFLEWSERDPGWAEDILVRELRAAEELAELTGDV